MTKYLMILATAIPILATAQFNNLKLEKGQVIYEKIYSVDSSNKDIVERMLTLNMPKVKDIADFFKTSEIITAKIRNANIDYRKYGGKWGNTSAFLNHPFYGDVSVVWKDGKYRVTITNMYFNTSGLGVLKCSDLFTKRRGTEFADSKSIITAGLYMENYLTDLFNISETTKGEW